MAGKVNEKVQNNCLVGCLCKMHVNGYHCPLTNILGI